jgi:tripartite-type tricarboxylate transporter receptor subunit TctC
VFAAANFNFRRDMAPIANAVRLPGIISVNPSLPVRTLAEFIAYAKANPDKVNIGSGGIGSPQYVAGELFIMMTGARLSMIAYRGGPPALTDAMSGQIQGLISAILLVVDQVRAGNLRALAVTSTSRSELLPDVPTVAETVPGFAADQWIGMAAPRGTPDNVIATLNAGINAALADPAIKRTIASLGGMPMPSTPADFGQFLTDETDKWAKVVKFSGVKAD